MAKVIKSVKTVYLYGILLTVNHALYCISVFVPCWNLQGFDGFLLEYNFKQFGSFLLAYTDTD